MRLKYVFKEPPKAFLFLATVFGVLFVVLVPPFQAIDEVTHYWRAYQIAGLEIMPSKVVNGAGVGGALPDSVRKTSAELLADPHDPNYKYGWDEFYSYTNQPLMRQKSSIQTFEGSSVYPPTVYLPQSIGIGLTKVFDLAPIFSLYFGRLFNLASWIAICYIAIKIVPVAKWAFLVLALLPMTLSQAASVSADAPTNALALLMVALFIKFSLQKRLVTNRQLLLLGTITILLAFTKPSYAVLSLLLLAFPVSRFGSLRRYVKSMAAIIGGSLAISLIWTYVVKEFVKIMQIAQSGHQADLKEQFIFVLQQPFHFIEALFNAYLTPYSDVMVTQFIGVFGWGDVFLPLWATIGGYVLVAMALLSSERMGEAFSKFSKPIILSVIILALVAIATALYFSFTPVGAEVVGGLNGRYLWPISLLLVLLFLRKNGPRRLSDTRQLALFIGMVTLLVTSIITVFERYYL